MLKKLFFTGVILSLFSLVGCSSDEQGEEKVSSLTDEVKVETNEIESLQSQIQFLNEQNQYLVTTINDVVTNLSNEEMLQFSKDQVAYALRINEEPIPKNGQIAVGAGIVEILLSEKVLGFDFLPEEWLEKGKISGDYIDHLLNVDTTNWMPIGTDGTVNTARGYQSADKKADQQFSFTITEELRERLEIDTTFIQIKVN